MLKPIQTRDELERVLRGRRGYLYNDYGGRNPQMCPIHDLASCPWLSSMLRASPGRLSVPKLWSENLAELVADIRLRGKVFAACRSEPHLVAALAGASDDPAEPSRSVPPVPNAPARAEPEFEIREDHDARVVEGWCAERLPFESAGPLRRLRAALGMAVESLVPDVGRMLHAIYRSDVVERVDAENVLIYNVGPARFRTACRNGLRFERSPDTPPPGPSGREYAHYHRYAIVDSATAADHWRPGRVAARWDQVTLGTRNDAMRGGAVWRAMKTARPALEQPLRNGWFGLRIVAHTPGDRSNDAASLIKPLVDGIVAAFHRHDGHDVEELSRRLAFLHGIGASSARELLLDEDTAVLGTRRLLWRRSGGVQWDPGDDACGFGELRLEPGAPAWAISGELFELEPR